MTDEKKEMPWQIIHSCMAGNESPGYPQNCEASGGRCLESSLLWRIVPEDEAIRLHLLDERVKKFEEAGGLILSVSDIQGLQVKVVHGWEDFRILTAIKLLREAMGEK